MQLVGRGKNSPAYFHSMSQDHHLFMHLDTKSVYCLPENYQVIKGYVEDIAHNVDPTYTEEDIQKLQSGAASTYDISKRKYIPGFIGLNNVKQHDYLNCVAQAFAHLPRVRDWALRRGSDGAASPCSF